MNTTEIFNLFLLISAIIGFVFSGILFYSKNGRDRSMLFLKLMILSIALNNLQSWVLAEGLFQHKFKLVYLQIPWHFLSAPLFYMFLINYLGIEKKEPNILKIIVPVFILACIAQVIFVTRYGGTNNTSYLDLLYEKYTTGEEIVSFLTSISVFGYAFYILYKKEKLFPKILSFDNLKWLYNFFILLCFCYIFWIIALIIKVNLNFSGFLFSYYPLRILTTILIFWLGYQGILHLQILKDRKEIREKISLDDKILSDEKEKTQNSKFEKEFEELDTYIRKNKKFLQSKYTLQNLSKDLKLSSSKLSSVINSNANKSFIDYINEMRVEQAKKLLTNPEYSDYTIIAIGLESGFNSKSAFYNVFKKHTGCTPLAYKNSYDC